MPVYFIRAGADGPVKIGCAVDVAARIKILQCGYPFDLVIMRQVDGGRSKEAAFHRHFRHLRVRGEWFRWDPEMLTADVQAQEPEQTTATSPTMTAFLAEVELFCRDLGMTASTFSRRFANDGKFLRRLRAGATMRCETLDRAHAYMAEERAAHIGKAA